MPSPSKLSKSAHKDSDDAETPSNNLWVANLPNDVTDSDLMDLFAKYDALDSVTSYSSRSYAFIFFKRTEDAQAAKNALQGTVLRGSSLKIEFARPAKPGKHLWVGGISQTVSKEELEKEFTKFGKIESFKFLRDRNTASVEYVRLEDASQAMRHMNGKRIGGEQIRVDFFRSQASRRTSQFSGALRGEGQPSNVLWIGYPPSIQIDEQMLHNAMILFGEIEKIKSFPSRHYSFVEFRSIDEARRAKEGLQGRLFNDPRIVIMFSSSELAPGKDYPSNYSGSGIIGTRPEVFLSEHPYRLSQIDPLAHARSMVHSNIPGPLPTRPNMSMRGFGGQGSYEPLLGGLDYNDLARPHGFQDRNSKSLMSSTWRRSSPPAPGTLSSPPPGSRSSARSSSGAWDVLDVNQFEREPKRLRMDGTSRISPVGVRTTAQGPGRSHGDTDFMWRGIIAKGGTPVCNARCVPVGEGISSVLPEVVNCSARTGLDQLTKHYSEAIGFEIVFFLPDSEDDFASYTEFLRYLGSKDRAGVAKFDDGTTLFLVPPSDFLTNVLKVAGPERLYGVVLKFPHIPSSNEPTRQQSHLSIPSPHYLDRQHPLSLQPDYGMAPLKEEYTGILREETKVPPKLLGPSTTELPSLQSSSQEYVAPNTTSITQSGVSLTPELIATLASFLPGATQSSSLESAQPPSSSARPQFPPVLPNEGTQSEGWKQEHQSFEHTTGPSFQQMGTSFNHQGQPHSQFHQPYPSFPNLPSHSAQLVNESMQMQESTFNLPQQVAIPSRPMTNYSNPPENRQVTALPLANPQYQHDVSHMIKRSYGAGPVYGIDNSGYTPVTQQPNNSLAFSNQGQGGNSSISHGTSQLGGDRVNPEPLKQVQQLQSTLLGSSGSTEIETDKNQRYQSTLQFAASLLQQIQQQQAARGSGSQ